MSPGFRRGSFADLLDGDRRRRSAAGSRSLLCEYRAADAGDDKHRRRPPRGARERHSRPAPFSPITYTHIDARAKESLECARPYAACPHAARRCRRERPDAPTSRYDATAGVLPGWLACRGDPQLSWGFDAVGDPGDGPGLLRWRGACSPGRERRDHVRSGGAPTALRRGDGRRRCSRWREPGPRVAAGPLGAATRRRRHEHGQSGGLRGGSR